MDFRHTHCVWCRLKTGPLEDCTGCPRFRMHGLGQEIELDWRAFCTVCANYEGTEFATFCETNRKLQQGSGEPFDCYKYSFERRGAEGAAASAHVVTVFLVHQGKVCLVRRSSRVGTYQGRWSGISGYLEGDPDEHFMTELREETTLVPGEYTLLRKADTVAVEDAKEGRIWYVHPFLCEVSDPSRITLDWENTEHRWFEPQEMEGLDTVPGLSTVFECVSRLPLERDTSEFARALKDDRESGARQLAYRALDFAGRIARSSNAARTVVLMDDLHYACHEIALARPSMAIVSVTLELLMRDVQAGASMNVEDARGQVLSLVRRNIKEMDSAMDRVANHLEGIVPRGATVLVHSYSSSLIHALHMLKDRECSLVVTESRPGFEGRTVAQIARDMEIKVRLVVDAAAGMELGCADVVLLGADSIEADGSVVNKTGSSLIAMAAQRLGVPVYFLGEVRKIMARGKRADLEEYGPEEVWDRAPRGIEVRNPYFDRTGPEFITGIVLEDGIVKPGEIEGMALSLAPRGST